MNKVFKSKLMTVFALILSVCMLFGTVAMINGTVAKAENTTSIASLVEGASVRVTSKDSSGIKFKAQLNKAQYNELYNQYGGNVKAGMIIVPTDYIEEANGYSFSAFSAAGKTVGSKTIAEFKEVGDNYEFTMSLVNLYAKNYARDFEAIVYIEIESAEAVANADAFGGKYYLYAERNASYARNIYSVAKAVYNDRVDVQDEKHAELVNGKYATLNADGLDIAKSFIDGVTEIVLEAGKPVAYSSEYYVANANVVTNDTEAYVMGAPTTIVYNGEVVTAPYVDGENGISVKSVKVDANASYKDGAYTLTGFYPGSNTYTSLQSSTQGYVAFEGEYGAGTAVEYEFTGNNMPQVMLFASNVSQNLGGNGGLGVLALNGFNWNNGGTLSGTTTRYNIFGINRMNQPLTFSASLYYADNEFAQAQLADGANYRYVVGTKVVLEDVNHATVADANNLYIGQDGVMEKVLHFVAELYNADTDELIASIDTKLLSKTIAQGSYGSSAGNLLYRYVTVDDLPAANIVAYAGLKGQDGEGVANPTTFKVTKAPYHVHSYIDVKGDANGHWYECACGAASEKVAHTGGTATHTEQAKCEVCGEKYGDLRANYDVDDVKLVNMDTISASKVISARSGEVTFTGVEGANNYQSAASIGLLTSTTTEFLKVNFKALADATNTNAGRNLQIATKLWFGLRRTEAQITGNSLCANTWAVGPASNSNDMMSYYGSAVKYFSQTGDTKDLTNWYWNAGAISKGDDCYWLLGFTSGGDLKIALVNATTNKVILRCTKVAANVTAAGTPAESGFFSIHSFAEEEQTISWEIISASQADYYWNAGAGVEGLAVNGATASWTAYDGATAYKVSVNDGEWTTVNTNSYTVSGLKAFDNATIAVKAVCDGFETTASEVEFIYSPIKLLGVKTITAEEGLTATKGTVTITNEGASATIALVDDGNSFVKVGFTSVAGDGTMYSDKTLALAVGVRGVAENSATKNWTVAPWGNANGAYICKDYSNRSHFGGIGTRIGSYSFNTVMEGVAYSFLTGVVGQGDDAVFHWYWLDENDNVLRGIVITKAELDAKYAVDMPENGYFTITNTAAVERTLSYEVIAAEEVFKHANLGTVANVKNTGATVSWDAVANAKSYSVSVNGGEWVNNGTATSYAIANAVAGGQYEVEVKANLGYYAATGKVNFTYEPIKFLKTSSATIAQGSTATKGSVTLTADAEALGTNETATVVLDGEYTDEFVKVGFTALESGSGRTYMPNQTIAIAVGVRGISTAGYLTNYAMSPWGNTNWVYFTGSYGTISHMGGLSDYATTKHWDGIVKGETYYVVTGMVGSDYNKSTADTADDAVFYWMLLDKDDSVRVRVTVTAEELLTKKPAATIRESGVFTIHNLSTAERTFTYEVIDSATALGYLG